MGNVKPSDDAKADRLEHIEVSLMGNAEYIPIEEVYYFSMDSKVMTMRFNRGEETIDKTFEELETALLGSFIRTNCCTLVAKSYIKSLSKNLSKTYAGRILLANIDVSIGTKIAQLEHIEVKDRCGDIACISIDDVYYFSTYAGIMTMRIKGGEVIIDETIESLELALLGKFIRIHRNTLVAKKHAKSLQKTTIGRILLTLDISDERLEVGRTHLKKVRRFIGKIQA